MNCIMIAFYISFCCCGMDPIPNGLNKLETTIVVDGTTIAEPDHNEADFSSNKEVVSVDEEAKKINWKWIRENLDKILEYGRHEGIIERKFINISAQNATTKSADQNHLDNEDELEREAKKELSFIHSAIPYLPMVPAIFCCVINVILPGSGTALSGFFSLCSGQCRVQTKEFRKGVTLLVNLAIGVCQLNTVSFFLVGWFWSITWGALMVMFAVQYRHVIQKKRKVIVATAAIEALTNNDLRRRQNVSRLLQQVTSAKKLEVVESEQKDMMDDGEVNEKSDKCMMNITLLNLRIYP